MSNIPTVQDCSMCKLNVDENKIRKEIEDRVRIEEEKECSIECDSKLVIGLTVIILIMFLYILIKQDKCSKQN